MVKYNWVIGIILIITTVYAAWAYTAPNNHNIELVLDTGYEAPNNHEILLELKDIGAAGEPPVEDPCAYSGSGAYIVNCSACNVINTAVNATTYKIHFTGTGSVYVNNTISGSYIVIDNTCTVSNLVLNMKVTK